MDKTQRKKITSLRKCKFLLRKRELGRPNCRCVNALIKITAFCDVMPCNLIDIDV